MVATTKVIVPEEAKEVVEEEDAAKPLPSRLLVIGVIVGVILKMIVMLLKTVLAMFYRMLPLRQSYLPMNQIFNRKVLLFCWEKRLADLII